MERQIALYMRLSLEDVDKRTNGMKDESNSIAAQRLLLNQHLDGCPDLCDLQRIEYIDDGYSGTHFDRPEFKKMMDMAKHGQIGCIVVKDLSRFGRSYLEVGDYLEHVFPFLDIRFKAVNDHYDSERNRGRTLGLDLTFKNLVYDYYSKDLSRKVKSAMRVRQKEGHYVSCPPFGYSVQPRDKHRLVVDPQTAPIVKRIFSDIIAGKSSTQVARELNEEGVPTPLQYKGIRRKNIEGTSQWTHQAVLGILGNIKYTGTMVNHTRENASIRAKQQRHVPQSEWFVRENAHEAIVSREEYEAAQNAIGHRRDTVKQARDVTDRVYICGHCGKKLEKANETVFACRSRRYHVSSPCEKVHMRKTELEDVLFEALRKQVLIARMERKRRKNHPAQIERLRAKLERLNAKAAAFGNKKFESYMAYRAGKWTAEDYKAKCAEMAVQQAKLIEEIERCEEELCSFSQTEKEVETGIERMTGLSDAQLRKHLYDAVERVYVYGKDEIEIVWKFDTNVI